VEYHVRSARLTDVDPAIRILMRDANDPGEQRDGADRLRSLLFLPAATVFVAEADRRLIGAGVLSIRPTIWPGPFVGVIDALGTVEVGETGGAGVPGRLEVGSSIIEHLVSSARNKGCARVEVTDPLASAESKLLGAAGFERRGALLSRAIG
jgi:predicted N-acetyltransferase YhbS